MKSMVPKPPRRDKGLLCVENKRVKCYVIPENIPKCLVFLLNLYMKHLPKYAFENDVLYLQPKLKCPGDSDMLWYEEKPVGKNTLSSMMKDMGAEAGTMHSLCATGVSNLFHVNAPERIIQNTTESIAHQ